MPTYGYRCPACGNEFDVWQRMSDPPSAACPSCGAAATRLFFPAGIVFKGTGFYVTDSRKSTAAASSSSSNGSSADGKPTPSKDSPGKDPPGKASTGGTASTSSSPTTS